MNSFFAMLSRMKYINRWGLMRCTRTETLSEHTLEVAMLTHALIAIGNSDCGANLDAGQGVLLALYHDSAEIITGDLPTPVKYHDDAIKLAYGEIERQAERRLLSLLPATLQGEFAQYMTVGEDFAAYRPYIKAADKLSAVIKCAEELNAGNKEFEKANTSSLSHPSLKLPAAEIFIKKYLPAYTLTLDELESF